MPRRRDPYLPWFFDDFRGSPKVQLMSRACQMGYLWLLAYLWQEGTVADDPEVIRRICQATPEEWSLEGALVMACLRPAPDQPGRLHSPRMSSEREYRDAQSERYRLLRSRRGNTSGDTSGDTKGNPHPHRGAAALARQGGAPARDDSPRARVAPGAGPSLADQGPAGPATARRSMVDCPRCPKITPPQRATVVSLRDEARCPEHGGARRLAASLECDACGRFSFVYTHPTACACPLEDSALPEA